MRRIVFGLLAFVFCLGQASIRPKAAEHVDLVLVLAVDVSGSVTEGRWLIQREGYARAFRSPEVQRAIFGGGTGSIAVIFVQWAGIIQQYHSAWNVISDRASAFAFAESVASTTRAFPEGGTAIGAALDFSHRLILGSGFKALRYVIDISGDGRNNETSAPGETVTRVRARILQDGFTINGLPVLGDATEVGLVDYFRDNVIGGPGAFIEVITNPDDVARVERSIRRKLEREISLAE
jgi:Protein of unknown function (DUF1194)